MSFLFKNLTFKENDEESFSKTKRLHRFEFLVVVVFVVVIIIQTEEHASIMLIEK